MTKSFSAAIAPLLVTPLLSMLAVSTGIAQTPWPTERWPETSPEAVGLNSETLDSIDAEIRAGEYGYVDRFLVIRNGQLAYDRRYRNDYDRIYGDSARLGTMFLNHHRAGPYNYFNSWWHPYYRRGDLHTLQSVTKTVTSIVIGAAVTRDEFPSLDTPVLSFFDSGTVANVDDRKRRMTVRHLLTMTAGLDWDEVGAVLGEEATVDALESSYDWVQFTIDRPMAEEPGTRFNYNSGASQLLSHIFHKATGSDIEEYAARHLFAPLGIDDWFWKRTPAGLPDTEGGLYLASEDLAKLWLLFLREGTWDGQEVVSPDWVRASVAPAIAVHDPARPSGVHYGRKWWLHPNPTDRTRFMWLGSGFGGQFPIAIPEQDLIIVINQWNILPSEPWLVPEPIVARILRGLTDDRRSGLVLAVTVAALLPPHAAPAQEPVSYPVSQAAVPDTTRFTIIINGHRQGERRMWQEAPDTWRYEHDGDAYHFPRTERLVLDPQGFPLLLEIDGQRIVWDRWFERYERSDGRARWMAHARSSLGPEWSRSLDEGEGEAEVSGPAYYASFHPVHDLGVLARLLLRQPGRTVPLLPDGTARLEPVGERWVDASGMRRRVRLFAIHGLDLQPSYVWLDDDGATFADEWSVLAGWEAAFPELRAASDAALAEHHRRLVDDLVPPARERPLVVRGARLFDPKTGAIEPGTTIIVDGVRISAVGPDGALDLPPGAEVVDAAGRTVLPGLWDMHAHHGFPGPYFELIAPLYLAGGITVARDLGMPMEPMLSLRRRVQSGDAVGPRLLMAGWVGGAGGRPTGTLVGNPAEATAAVDRFAELGYVQIKIYSDLPHELVPVVIERAKQHGLRVSGEVPTGMTAREAVAHGYEEIQHIDGLLLPLADSLLTEFYAQPTPAGLQEVNEALAELKPDSRAVQELTRLLAAEGVAVDPTLTVFATQGMEPPEWVARVAGRFPSQARRRILDRHLFGYWPLTPLWDEILGNMTALVGALHQAGVPILAGTDTEMAAFDLHEELALYVEGGIPAPEVLALATLAAAQVMGMDDELGSVEAGKLADFILVDGDPAADIDDLRRVVMVVKDGRVYEPAAIYRALGIEP